MELSRRLQQGARYVGGTDDQTCEEYQAESRRCRLGSGDSRGDRGGRLQQLEHTHDHHHGVRELDHVDYFDCHKLDYDDNDRGCELDDDDFGRNLGLGSALEVPGRPAGDLHRDIQGHLGYLHVLDEPHDRSAGIGLALRGDQLLGQVRAGKSRQEELHLQRTDVIGHRRDVPE